jgi:hypothetical protein
LIQVLLLVLVALQIPFHQQDQFHQEYLAGLLNLVVLGHQGNQLHQHALFHLVVLAIHVHHLVQMVLVDQAHL